MNFAYFKFFLCRNTYFFLQMMFHNHDLDGNEQYDVKFTHQI